MAVALIAAIAAFFCVASLMALVSGATRNPVEARLNRLAPGNPRVSMEAPFGDRVFIPVLGGFGRLIEQLLPHTFVARIQRQLLAAGSPMTTQTFFTIVLISGVLVPAGAIFFAVRVGDASANWVLVSLLFCAVGAIGPFIWLRRRVRVRKTTIWRSLSDAFDLITVCVEAGLGLDAAMRQVAAKLKSPLAEELAITLRQVGMGRPRREALEDMAQRVDLSEVTTFVNAVIQAEQLGTSLGRVLRAQSVTIRIRRRQKAEELARRAPVKMVFPLVVFIMPTFFIVTLGPFVVHFLNYVKG